MSISLTWHLQGLLQASSQESELSVLLKRLLESEQMRSINEPFLGHGLVLCRLYSSADDWAVAILRALCSAQNNGFCKKLYDRLQPDEMMCAATMA